MKVIDYFKKQIKNSYLGNIETNEFELRKIIALETIALQLCIINKREMEVEMERQIRNKM